MERMKELTQQLRLASQAYYQRDEEIMSNLEYDRLYDELVTLEKETGIVLSGSPTVTVGYESLEQLPKERHEAPMLSLDKTKSVEELAAFAGTQEVLMSWKLDGLTVVLTYQNGTLQKAVTRGNGEVGEVITNNARVFQNIPLHISYQGELILRGEAVITYSDFEKINAESLDAETRYKNPRNLCSGSVRQLNNEITARRHVHFYAFALVKADGTDFKNLHSNQFEWLKEQGFETVEYHKVTAKEIPSTVAWFEKKIRHYDVPSDGLVVTYNDIAYGESLGRTAKFPRNSIAFKWQDEVRETVLREIEWSPSRTGLINPIAVFDPVELEGTTVSRASVHNLSIMKSLRLGIGDTITVYKANMIIPQIAENLTGSGNAPVPEYCPACGGKTEICQMNNVETLYCTNSRCSARRIKSFSLFVSRDAMNIEGLSEATLEKFIAHGYIHTFADIYHLNHYREEIVSMDGFGEKSYQNLMESIDRSRKTTLARVIYALGIPNIGAANAKLLCRFFNYDLKRLREANEEEIASIEGIGDVIAASVVNYFEEEANKTALEALLYELDIEKPEENENSSVLAGKTFVITGSVFHFANRSELKNYIEERGGKVTGSVTKKTDYLINNEKESNSSKNKKARELNIPLLSEEDFLKLAGEPVDSDAADDTEK